MKRILDLLRSRQPRGLSMPATLVLAAVLVLLGWGLIKAIIGTIVGLLAWAIHIGAMVLIFLLIVWAIRTVSKKTV
ncbi:MAG TPA: hypothetical protein VGP72_12760 [Planctomycetota bacterium]|jgi:hypothetical protein